MNFLFVRESQRQTDRTRWKLVPLTLSDCSASDLSSDQRTGEAKGIGRAGADLRRHTEVNGCEEEAAVSGSGSSGRAHNRTTSPLPTLPTPASHTSHTTHTASAFLGGVGVCVWGGGGERERWEGGGRGGMQTVRVTATIPTVFAFILAKKDRRVNRPNQVKSICIIDQYTKQLRSLSATRMLNDIFF